VPRKAAFVETCWVLVGERRGRVWRCRRLRPTRGEPSQVAFDGPAALAREERRGDVVGFYHTHPGGPPRPSRRDVRTMRAWASAFGKPLVCLIESDGKLAGWRFNDDESAGVAMAAVERFPRGVVIAVD
jgi:proteasome lid subunit RPN8/RPN11